jgi:hypothetical protein
MRDSLRRTRRLEVRYPGQRGGYQRLGARPSSLSRAERWVGLARRERGPCVLGHARARVVAEQQDASRYVRAPARRRIELRNRIALVTGARRLVARSRRHSAHAV